MTENCGLSHFSCVFFSNERNREGKVQAFERPYFHDERERLSTRYYESLATYAGQACLPLSLVASRLMYLCISTDWLLLDSHSRIYAGETASRTSVNRPYSLRTIKKNNIVNIDANSLIFFKRGVNKV